MAEARNDQPVHPEPPAGSAQEVPKLFWTPNGISLEDRLLTPKAVENVKAFFRRFAGSDESPR